MVHASDAFDHFGRIAGVVSLHDIQNAARILQRFIALEHLESRRLEFRRAGLVDPGKSRAFGRVPQLLLIGVVTPGFVVVLLLRRIPAREEARIGIELVVVAKQAGSVRVAEDIVLVIELVLQDVVDHPAEERNIGARTQPTVDVGLGRRTRITRIDHDPGGAAVLCALHPTRAQRVVFDIVGANRENDVGVGKVTPMARHGAAAEARRKTGHCRGVAHARLIVNGNDTERTGELLNEPPFFIVKLCCTQTCDTVAAVDRHAVFGFHKARITGLFDVTCNFLGGLVP